MPPLVIIWSKRSLLHDKCMINRDGSGLFYYVVLLLIKNVEIKFILTFFYFYSIIYIESKKRSKKIGVGSYD
mgnify:CR=1 FL=1